MGLRELVSHASASVAWLVENVFNSVGGQAKPCDETPSEVALTIYLVVASGMWRLTLKQKVD